MKDRLRHTGLTALFKPRSVAVIGASPHVDHVGGLVFANLLASGFPGAIHAVNPKHREIAGHPCLRRIEDIEGPVDLAALCTPAASVEKLLVQCARKGVGAAVILGRHPDGGRRERAWRQRLRDLARKHGIRLLGPNSMGLWRARQRLNLLYNRNRLTAGPVALVSHSAGLCDALLDWCEAHERGFSTVLTPGDGADIELGEIIRYLALEPDTRLILAYLERIEADEAPRLVAALRLAAALKPVLVFTGGRPEDACLEGALQHTGAVLLYGIDPLFPVIDRLLAERIPRGDSPLLLGNATGPDHLATNRLRRYGLAPARPDARLARRLRRLGAVRLEPGVVMPADLDAARLERVLDTLAESGQDDCLLLLAPRPQTDAGPLLERARNRAHPAVMSCLMGEAHSAPIRQVQQARGEFVFDTPAALVDTWATLAAWRRQQAAVGHLPRACPPALDETLAAIRREATRTAPEALDRGRVFAWLARIGLPVPELRIAESLSAALRIAEQDGFPLRLRPRNLACPGPREGLAHDRASLRHQYLALAAAQQACRDRSPVRGVLIEPAPDLEAARLPLRLHLRRDPVWRCVLEVELRDPPARHCVPLPLDDTLARLWTTHEARRALAPVRHWLPRLSALLAEVPQIIDLAIPDIRQTRDGPLVIQAQATLSTATPETPYAHLLVHPLPPALERQTSLPDGTPLHIRPLRPEDAQPPPERWLEGLSPESLRQRFLHPQPRLTRELVAQLSILDLHRELALVAFPAGHADPVGVARFVCDEEGAAEFAVLVADDWQGRGIGRRLMQALIEAARWRGCHLLYGDVLRDNRGMRRFAARFGFGESSGDDGILRITLPLIDPDAHTPAIDQPT